MAKFSVQLQIRISDPLCIFHYHKKIKLGNKIDGFLRFTENVLSSLKFKDVTQMKSNKVLKNN